jgi:thiol-disulfide isomerase/thioredoxin
MTKPLVQNFISYDSLLNSFQNTGIYDSLLLKFGGEKCPPCRALDQGPLENLNKLINNSLEKNNKKKLLIINCDVGKDDLIELINKTNIIPPKSIPAFFLLKYNEDNNQFIFLNTSVGYDMLEPTKWLDNFSQLIIKYLN